MPRLVKGGKYTYGWSQVDKSGALLLPPDAMVEYGFKTGDRVILINGSRRSGGFGVAFPHHLETSPLYTFIEQIPEAVRMQTTDGQIVKSGWRSLCWTTIDAIGAIRVPPVSLVEYEVKPQDILLSVRGSNRALAFVVKGPIVEEAKRHPELPFFSLNTI